MTRRGASLAAPLAALTCAVVVAGCGSGGGAGTGVAATNCSAVPREPAAVLAYRLQTGAEGVSEAPAKETIAILCRRLAAAAGGAEVGVAPLGGDRIRVSLGSGAATVTSEEVEAPGGLYLYDWEPNLIGPERARGGYSTAYGAVRLASEQRPVEECSRCSATVPRFYLFSAAPRHELLAGPAVSETSLYLRPGGQPLGEGQVLEVPVGTIVVSDGRGRRGGGTRSGTTRRCPAPRSSRRVRGSTNSGRRR